MSHVYRIESIHGDGTEYVNTSREADQCRPGGELPESVTRVDAAGECNRLERYVRETERFAQSVRLLLEQLRDECSVEVITGTAIGRKVNQFLADNPLPAATAADRDGQRSYGGG